MNNIERSIFKIVEKGGHGSNIYRVFDYSIMILILLNVIAIIMGLIYNASCTKAEDKMNASEERSEP